MKQLYQQQANSASPTLTPSNDPKLDRLIRNARRALIEIGAYYDRRRDTSQKFKLQRRLAKLVDAVCDPFGVRSIVRDTAQVQAAREAEAAAR